MTHIFDFWLQIYDSLCCSESCLDQIIQVFKLEAGTMCIRFRRNVRNIARLTFSAVRKILDFEKFVSLHVTRLKTGFLLTYPTEVKFTVQQVFSFFPQ